MHNRWFRVCHSHCIDVCVNMGAERPDVSIDYTSLFGWLAGLRTTPGSNQGSLFLALGSGLAPDSALKPIWCKDSNLGGPYVKAVTQSLEDVSGLLSLILKTCSLDSLLLLQPNFLQLPPDTAIGSPSTSCGRSPFQWRTPQIPHLPLFTHYLSCIPKP